MAHTRPNPSPVRLKLTLTVSDCVCTCTEPETEPQRSPHSVQGLVFAAIAPPVPRMHTFDFVLFRTHFRTTTSGRAPCGCYAACTLVLCLEWCSIGCERRSGSGSGSQSGLAVRSDDATRHAAMTVTPISCYDCDPYLISISHAITVTSFYECDSNPYPHCISASTSTGGVCHGQTTHSG